MYSVRKMNFREKSQKIEKDHKQQKIDTAEAMVHKWLRNPQIK